MVDRSRHDLSLPELRSLYIEHAVKQARKRAERNWTLFMECQRGDVLKVVAARHDIDDTYVSTLVNAVKRWLRDTHHIEPVGGRERARRNEAAAQRRIVAAFYRENPRATILRVARNTGVLAWRVQRIRRELIAAGEMPPGSRNPYRDRKWCRKGHDLTAPEASRLTKDGSTRLCRQCERDRHSRYKNSANGATRTEGGAAPLPAG